MFLVAVDAADVVVVTVVVVGLIVHALVSSI
jgi:hypothetical protein